MKSRIEPSFYYKNLPAMLFLGFSAGLPLLLIFSSLSLWLNEGGIEKKAVTYFSWAALGYSFKFIWAPLVDQISIKWLSRLGQRRSWLLCSQLCVMLAIIAIGSIDPAKSLEHLKWMAFAAVFLGFSSATQDVVIDAFRIESAAVEHQALLSSVYIAGYRIGMLASGAGALILASHWGSSLEHYDYEAWQWTYYVMALTMLAGITTTLSIDEPKYRVANQQAQQHNKNKSWRFLSLFLLLVLSFIYSYNWLGSVLQEFSSAIDSSFIKQSPLIQFGFEVAQLAGAFGLVLLTAKILSYTPMYQADMMYRLYKAPIKEFLDRFGLRTACILLVFIGFYRVSDIVLGVIANIFYQDMGFSKIEIAGVSKTFGLLMTILGGFIGGILSLRLGVMKLLGLGAVLTVATNFLFIHMANTGYDLSLLYLVISADNLAGGIASAAFIAFISSLTHTTFTAIQYALFSSMMTLLPKVLGGYSGSMVDAMGYPSFFFITSLMGVPIIFLVFTVNKILKKHNETPKPS